jgi:hypothetical protein
LVCCALRAFANNPAAIFFIETLPASGRFPRPDLILSHPDPGVVATRAKMKLYVLGVKSPHRPAELLEEIATASHTLHGGPSADS